MLCKYNTVVSPILNSKMIHYIRVANGHDHGHVFVTGHISQWPWPWPVMTGQVEYQKSQAISSHGLQKRGRRMLPDSVWDIKYERSQEYFCNSICLWCLHPSWVNFLVNLVEFPGSNLTGHDHGHVFVTGHIFRTAWPVMTITISNPVSVT